MEKITKEEINALQAFADVISQNAKSLQKRVLLDENALFWTLDAIYNAANMVRLQTYALDALNRKRGK